jgi:hypothetical protein
MLKGKNDGSVVSVSILCNSNTVPEGFSLAVSCEVGIIAMVCELQRCCVDLQISRASENK